jgi:hypothetical protein
MSDYPRDRQDAAKLDTLHRGNQRRARSAHLLSVLTEAERVREREWKAERDRAALDEGFRPETDADERTLSARENEAGPPDALKRNASVSQHYRQLEEARARLERAQQWLDAVKACDVLLSAPEAAVVCHIAGEKGNVDQGGMTPMNETVQRCTRCDRILERAPYGWEVGARVGEMPAGVNTDGGFVTFNVADVPLCAVPAPKRDSQGRTP